jgi:hypothetical protein
MVTADRPSQALLNAQKELQRRRRMAGVLTRPPQRLVEDQAASGWFAVATETHSQAVEADSTPLPPSLGKAVRVSPTIAAWCLDKDHRHLGAALDGPYRLYKILQALDGQGCGWLANQTIERTLTRKGSTLTIYGRRQLKIMLKRGEGLFWNRVKCKGEVRIRLVSRAKVTALLGCGRLRGREVILPLSALLGNGRGRQAAVNAMLYASVHAGQINTKKETRPISRASVRRISGCSPYRQRHYEKRAGIRVESNIRIVGPYDEYKLARSRQYNKLPAYKHIDYQGKINRHRRGAAYLAVRLPNSYVVPDTLQVSHSCRQRTLNRLLDGLCHMGSGGSEREDFVRLYHRDVVTAVRFFNRDPQTIAFWPLKRGKGVRLWRSMGDLD